MLEPLMTESEIEHREKRGCALIDTLNKRYPNKYLGNKLNLIMVEETNDRLRLMRSAHINPKSDPNNFRVYRYAFRIYTESYVYFKYEDDDTIHFVPLE